MDFNKEIDSFTSEYSFSSLKVTGGSFSYILKRNDNTTKTPLVFLNGGTNCASMWFKYVMELSNEYTVLIFDYSSDFKTIKSQVIAMNELFNTLSIQTPILIGASFGGFIAQAYIQKFPSQVGGLILLSTAALSEKTFKSLRLKKLFIPLLLFYIKHCNYEKFKKKIILSTLNYVKGESKEVQQYVKDMFTYVFKDYTKEKDYHITSLLADIFNLDTVTSATFSFLHNKILLMLPEHDYFSKSIQEDLISIMNEGRVEYIQGGHIATVLKVSEYLVVIRRFLENL